VHTIDACGSSLPQEKTSTRYPFTTSADIVRVIKPRSAYASKRDFGCLLVVGGSDVYCGAPALAGMAALRTGVGLAIIAAPRSVAGTIRGFSPNLIVHSLDGDVVTPEDLVKISNLLTTSDALIIGPGIGRHPETERAVHLMIEKTIEVNKPVVIDADAIRALVKRKDLLKYASEVITPHAGEFKAISGLEPPQDWRQRLPICRRLASEWGCVVLLKGHDTVVVDGRRERVNRTGNPGMATGGMGDVLSGIIGTFLAQGAEPFFAAAAAAHVHGLAGDLAYRERGFHMVASDLIETLPIVLRKYDRLSRT
jgi:NAD(P)H-hydrate epimerase